MDKVRGRDALVGAWRLVSWENQAADGQVTYPMGSDPIGYVIYATDGRFSVTISRPGRARRRRPAQWDHRGEGPGRGGLCRLRRPLQLPRRPRRPSCGAVVVSQLGRQRPRAVGRTSRGSADPQRQPAAAGGQAPGPPPGLGAGRLISEPRLTAYLAGSTDRKVPPGGQEPLWATIRPTSPQPTGRSVAWCSAPDWSTPAPG